MFEKFFPGRSRRTARPYAHVLMEKLTERARKVVVLAQEEARHFNHNYIGTEHLLLGLLREDEGVAARALGSLNVTLDEVREQVESIVGYGEGGTGGQAPFTPRSKKVLELAEREAVQLGYHNHLGTEHILLGLLREDKGIVARVFVRLDVDPDKVRRRVLHAIEYEKVPMSPLIRGDGVTKSTAFEARVEGLAVHVRCGVSNEERALPQALLVDLEYSYEAGGEDDIGGTVDYGMFLEEAAMVLEESEFKLLETGVRRVGDRVLSNFPAVREVTVSLTKLRVPVERSLSGVCVSATFRR